MMMKIIRRELEERVVAGHGGQLGKVLAQGIDLPPEEHVRIDRQARPGVERAEARERLVRRPRARSPHGEVEEALLQVAQGRRHRESPARGSGDEWGSSEADARSSESTSRSIACACRLSATRSSRGGIESSRSMSVGTRPKRRTAAR